MYFKKPERNLENLENIFKKRVATFLHVINDNSCKIKFFG